MKILCKYLGGSHSYGLNTPTSDLDDRFLFVHEEPSKIFGLERHDHQQRLNNSEDSFGWELRHFLYLLRNGNTMCLEMLYNDEWIEISDEFRWIQTYKTQLIDSHKLFKCLKGYCYSEKELVLGKRLGVIGGKRKTSFEQYGYSYKNLVQFLRLCLCGKVFFQTGIFPVNIRPHDSEDILFNIKTNPEKCSKEKAIELMDSYETMLVDSYNNIKILHVYNTNVVDLICYQLYMPILNSAKI